MKAFWILLGVKFLMMAMEIAIPVGLSVGRVKNSSIEFADHGKGQCLEQ